MGEGSVGVSQCLPLLRLLLLSKLTGKHSNHLAYFKLYQRGATEAQHGYGFGILRGLCDGQFSFNCSVIW